jgi:hypothetical protein
MAGRIVTSVALLAIARARSTAPLRPRDPSRPRPASRLRSRPPENFVWLRFVTTALLGLVLASSIATAAAQPADPPPLTIDSVRNAAYLAPALEMSGGSRLVQLTDGNYPSDSTPEAPTVDADGLNVVLFNNPQISATGDLNGDGAQDIVAVFVEAPTGYGLIWVVEAYLDQDGQAVPAAAIVGGNRASEPTSLSIQSGLITLNGLTVGGNDAMCCPSHPFTDVFSLQGDQLVDVSAPTSAQPAPAAPTSVVAGSVPATTADISSVRSAIPGPGGQSGFTGQVLMPPPGLQPFASLQLSSAVPVLGRDALSTSTSQIYPQSYQLFFVNAMEQSHGQFGVAGASVAGASSRQMYDDTAADFLTTFTGCARTAAFCARPNFPPCAGIGCMMQAEIFRGLKVKGADALVLHWQEDRAGGVGWDVTWYDSQAGVSYRLTTQNGADPGNFDAGLSANNQGGAQQLVAIAEKLVLWTGT